MAPHPAGQKVLIIAHDALLAALVGSLVETARLEPAFAREGEPPDAAIARVRPVLLLLLDAEDDLAESDLFLARAQRADIPVLLFGSRVAIRAREQWIVERSLAAFELPAEVDRLIVTLNHFRRGEGLRRLGERRQVPIAAYRPDHVFHDDVGRKWSVYDRRGAERRQGVERHFVSDDGEIRSCVLSGDEALDDSGQALAGQLARATPVRK